MKLKDYRPYYNRFLDNDTIRINGMQYNVSDENFWINLSEAELSEDNIQKLNLIDKSRFGEVFWRFKKKKEIINFLERNFSDYCVWQKGNPLNWLNYTLDFVKNNISYFIAWQIVIIEKWLTEKKEVYSKIKIKSKEDPLSLEDMFSDLGELQRITKELTKRSFVEDGIWQGRVDPKTARNPKEQLLAALAIVIKKRNFLIKKHYKATQTHKAFNNYFQVKTAGRYFKPGADVGEYERIFYFI